MQQDRPERRRRPSVRCSNCGKELPLRKGRPPASCPTCGAPQEYDDEDPLLRRQRARSPEFRGAIRVGVIVGGILGLVLGLFYGGLIYRDNESGTVILLSILHGLGFAILGCAFGFMAVASRMRR